MKYIIKESMYSTHPEGKFQHLPELIAMCNSLEGAKQFIENQNFGDSWVVIDDTSVELSNGICYYITHYQMVNITEWGVTRMFHIIPSEWDYT